MGAKSRGNFTIAACIRDCANRGAACEVCVRFSEYEQARWGDRRDNQRRRGRADVEVSGGARGRGQ